LQKKNREREKGGFEGEKRDFCVHSSELLMGYCLLNHNHKSTVMISCIFHIVTAEYNESNEEQNTTD